MADSFFKWDQEKLSTHVDAMDNEHKKLVEIMNRLYERSEAKASKDTARLPLKKRAKL